MDGMVCPECGAVRPAARTEAYTPQRGQLILAHGFCLCPTGDPAAQGAHHAGDGVAPPLGGVRANPGQAPIGAER